MKITEIDKNLQVKKYLKQDDIVYYDIRQAPFAIYGLYDNKNQSCFKRLPDEIGKNVNKGVSSLYLHTAGGRVRFSTNSKTVTVKLCYNGISRMSHMSLTGTSGLDLYLNDDESGMGSYYGTFIPDMKTEDILVSKLEFRDVRQRCITINFPSYSGVKEFHIGLDKNATLCEGAEYRNKLPVVFYGNSITQGACSSRPGNTYENIISNRMSLDYMNLGFSGSGMAEELIVDYMSDMNMCAFVSDYDYNAPNAKYLKHTHLRMYQKIRDKHPSIPYIILSRCNFDSGDKEVVERRDIIRETYRYAIEHGDENVCFIDGAYIFESSYKDFCTVEGVHLNDLGMAMMADKIENILKKYLL